MSLSNLPREILLDIADHLDDAGMNVLAHTNSQVYDLLNRLLYRRDVAKPQSKSLTWAAKYGVEGTIQQAINASQHMHFNRILERFQVALQVAVDQGHVRLVELLLQVDGINRGNDVLGIAADRGHVDTVKILLGHPDTDPNLVASGCTTLIQVCKPEVVELLLDQEGIEVNRQTDLSRAAYYSLVQSHLEVAKLLLEREDIDVNFRESNGWTALYWACNNSCLTLVDLLLERDDVDPNPRDIDSGYTPLAYVCHYSCTIRNVVAIVRSLLSHPDTDPNAVDNDGVSILTDIINRQNRCRLNYYSYPLLEDHHVEYDNEIEPLLRAAGAT